MAKRQADTVVRSAYDRRKEVLLAMGFQSYREYLASGLWVRTREKQLSSQPWCTGCGRKASQVHHLCYDKATMQGRRPSGLVSVCGRCHMTSEFDSIGTKLSIDEANKRLLAKLRSSPLASRNSRSLSKRR
jgi:hypothetical protein